MTDRPILFSGPMVRALLDGRKTQTRRVLKRHHLHKPEPHSISYHEGSLICRWKSGLRHDITAPYTLGDRLWVREAWRIGAWSVEEWSRGRGECDAGVAIDYLADDFPRKEWLQGPSPEKMLKLVEQSREDAEAAGHRSVSPNYEYSWAPGESPCRARPSIFMPRWASRMTLVVTDVRVQRLQDISEADAVAEGAEHAYDGAGEVWYSFKAGVPNDTSGCPVSAFSGLWNSLNAKRGFGWDENPWVTATTFTVHKCNIDQMGDT